MEGVVGRYSEAEQTTEDLEACSACRLWENLDPRKARNHLAVHGRGPIPAATMLIGEAPDRDAAHGGLSFVGPVGELLDQVLPVGGIDPDAVYMTNVVKHRTPRNRAPLMGEVKACLPHLKAEFDLVKPTTVITFGASALKVFAKGLTLKAEHGAPRKVEWEGHSFTLYPMYHPSYALRDASIYQVFVGDFERMNRVPVAETLETNYHLVADSAAASLSLSTNLIGFDIETTSPKKGRYLDVQSLETVGYSVSWAPGQAAYVGRSPGPMMAAVLENPLITKACHQAKFEYGAMRKLGIKMNGFEDTKLAAWLLQEFSSHLKALTRQYLGRDPITYKQVTGGKGMEELEPQEIKDYAAADADNTRLLWPILHSKLREARLLRLYDEVELPLVPVLDQMESVGVRVDQDKATALAQELEDAVTQAKESIWVAGLPREVDPASHEQLANALDLMGCPIDERTEAKRQLKTDESNLLQAKEREWRPTLIDAILEWRSLGKMRDYAKSYITLLGPDGRLHPDYVQTGYGEEASDSTSEAPVTGRLAARAPNLMNQPKRAGGEWVKKLRGCLVATEGWELVAADVSQEEVRVAAYVTQDPALLEAIRSGASVYEVFAQGVFGREIGKHTHPIEYNVAKQSILSFIWGSDGVRAWAPQLVTLMKENGGADISLRDAEAAYKRLEVQHKRIVQWRKEVWAEGYAQGYVRDYFGRRRMLPKFYHTNRNIKKEGWREAMNFLIQAPAATVLKKAMLKVSREFEAAGLQARLLIPVHDELVAEAPKSEVEAALRILSRMTEGVFPIELPVEPSHGPSWAEMEEWNAGS